MSTLDLQTFANRVNALGREQCERHNANNSQAMFKAQHIELPAAMLKYYHTRGYTPEQALYEATSSDAPL